MKNLNEPLVTTTIINNRIEVDSPHAIDNPSFNDADPISYVTRTFTNLFKTMH